MHYQVQVTDKINNFSLFFIMKIPFQGCFFILVLVKLLADVVMMSVCRQEVTGKINLIKSIPVLCNIWLSKQHKVANISTEIQPP